MPRRYQARAFDAKRRQHCPPDAVYVGRAVLGWPKSPWHNPYIVGVHVATRAEAVESFIPYADGKLAEEPGWLAPLVGRDLICWCPIDDGEPCHADVLMRLVQERYGRPPDAQP